MKRTIKEMREALYKVIKERGCYFKKSDLHFRNKGNVLEIIIEEYDHAPFRVISFPDDELLEADLGIFEADEIIGSVPVGKDGIGYLRAMETIGYRVANTF